MQLVATLDEYGKPAWITAMIVGFILWWPIGLGVLAYLIWSGRMGCVEIGWQWKQYLAGEARRFGGGMTRVPLDRQSRLRRLSRGDLAAA